MLVYTARVTNLGTGTATGGVVDVNIPVGTQLLFAGSSAGVCEGQVGRVRCMLDALAPGASVDQTVGLFVTMQSGSLEGFAQVDPDQTLAESDEGNNTASLVTPVGTGGAASATPTVSRSPTPSRSPTAALEATTTPTRSVTPSPSIPPITATATIAAPSVTALLASPTATSALPSATAEPPSPTATAAPPTATPETASPTVEPTAPFTRTATRTRTPTPTSPSATPTATASASPTSSRTVTVTPVPSATESPPGPSPTVPLGGLRYEDNSSAITYSAGWTQVLDPRASAEHYRRSAQVGATASFAFDSAGGTVRWAALLGPSGGRADVAIDGVFLATIDLYAPNPGSAVVALYATAAGRHTLRVTVRGDANAASAGTDVNVDFFETVEVVGGRNFTLLDQPVHLFWLPGTAQTGYRVARVSSSGTVLLPPGGPLAASATTYTDSTATGEPWYCYGVVPVRDADGLASSDVLCLVTGVRSTPALAGFTIRLNQTSVATLQWPAPLLSHTGYVLIAIGPTTRYLPFARGVTMADDDTGGAPICYVLVALEGDVPVANTDGLCAAPGLSSLSLAQTTQVRGIVGR